MQKARQEVLLQQSNIELLQIRISELSYFSTFYLSLGSQSALILGFAMNNMVQVQALSSDHHVFFKYLFWTTTALLISASMHNLVVSLFSYIYGYRLALNGPDGSVVTAVDGMLKDRGNIISSHICMIALLELSVVGTNMVVMDCNMGYLCSAIVFASMMYCYHRCLQKYNRFKIYMARLKWEEDSYLPPWYEENGKESAALRDSNNGPMTNFLQTKHKNSKSKFGRMLASFRGNQPRKVSFDQKRSKADIEKTLHRLSDDLRWFTKDRSVSYRGVKMEGYISLRSVSAVIPSAASNWKRRYFLLHGTMLYMYKSERAYELKPSAPIRARPLDISGYTVSLVSSEPPYQLTLMPIDMNDLRDKWELRFDTISEIESWASAMNEIHRTKTNTSSNTITSELVE